MSDPVTALAVVVYNRINREKARGPDANANPEERALAAPESVAALMSFLNTSGGFEKVAYGRSTYTSMSPFNTRQVEV